MSRGHIVIQQHIVTVNDDFVTEYSWPDRECHKTRAAAVKAGFKLTGSDDFNVAEVRDNQIVWFGWMDKQLHDYDLDEIAEHIYL